MCRRLLVTMYFHGLPYYVRENKSIVRHAALQSVLHVSARLLEHRALIRRSPRAARAATTKWHRNHELDMVGKGAPRLTDNHGAGGHRCQHNIEACGGGSACWPGAWRRYAGHPLGMADTDQNSRRVDKVRQPHHC